MTQKLHSSQCVFSSNLYSEIFLKLQSFCTLAVKRAIPVLLWVTRTHLYIHIVLLLFKSIYTCDIASVGVRFHPLDTQMGRWTASDSHNHSGTCVNLKRTHKR